MRAEYRKRLIWQVLGIVCYLAGLIVFLLTALEVYFAPPARSLETLSIEHMPLLALSLLLLVGGRLVTWKFGGSVSLGGLFGHAGGAGGPGDTGQYGTDDQLPPEADRRAVELRKMGYRIEPEEEANEVENGTSDRAICPECQTPNDPEFTYCQQCSSKLE